MRLFHFSDDPDIDVFRPRRVRVPSPRPNGRDWLNGPLVWAIDDWHQPLYFFPRDCPRILVWPVETTTPGDLDKRWDGGSRRMLAYVETVWMERLQAGRLTRYELPAPTFTNLHDAGMWVSREPVTPLARMELADLPAALEAANVELRPVETLLPLRGLWDTTLHVSGIRLRNAQDWQV